jgi:hypothetical protein
MMPEGLEDFREITVPSVIRKRIAIQGVACAAGVAAPACCAAFAAAGEQLSSDVGYPTEAAAMAAIRSDRSPIVRIKDGWLIASEPRRPLHKSQMGCPPR